MQSVRFVLPLLLLLSLAGPASSVDAAPITYFPNNFLENEATIVAYFHFAGPVNFKSNLLRNLFRNIISEKPGYLIGYIPSDGFSGFSQMDIKVFIHQSGWAVAYLVNLPTACFFDRGVSQVPRLAQALNKIASAIEAAGVEIHYFNFRYPLAARMMLLQTSVQNQSKTVDLRFPVSDTIYERAFYAYSNGIFGGLTLTLDGKQIGGAQNGLSCRLINPADMVEGARHIIQVSSGWNLSYLGMTFLFSGPDDFPVTSADSISYIDLSPLPPALALAAAEVPFDRLVYLPWIGAP